MKEITLLDPKNWDDRNDSYFMLQYKKYKGIKSLFALCFSQVPETYHHWHVFSKSPSGVCIKFNREKLLKVLQQETSIKYADVRYLTLKEAQEHDFKVEELPFLKRAGYKPEGEFRVIYESKKSIISSIDIAITCDCIDDIVLSPWLHESLGRAAKQAIQSIDGFEDLKVRRSTLISNEDWKKYASDLNEL